MGGPLLMIRHRTALLLLAVVLILGVLAGKAWALLDAAPTSQSAPSSSQSAGLGLVEVAVPEMAPLPEPPAPPPPPDPDDVLRARIVPSEGYWLAVHRCEQPDSWTVHGVFGNGLTGGGGLGISDGAWREWGGAEFGAMAGDASPLQQMVIASVGYSRLGNGPWGCKP